MSELPLFAENMTQKTQSFLHALTAPAKQERSETIVRLTREKQEPTTIEQQQEQKLKDIRRDLEEIKKESGLSANDPQPKTKRPTALETVAAIREPAQKERERTTFTVYSAIEKDDKRQQQQMEKQIEAEAKEASQKAAEAVRERYKQKNPREWNDSKRDKAFRGLVESLRK